jgi:ribosomal protein S18 acetylase RimI-like enzyme
MTTDGAIRMKPLTLELLPQASNVAARAFLNDPGFCYYFYDPKTRLQHLLEFWQGMIWMNLVKNQESWVAMKDDRVIGLICPVLPSDPEESLLLKVRAGLLRLPFVVGFTSTKRLLHAGDVIDSLKADMPKGLLYLEHIAVDPDYHKQGIGTIMINMMLEKAEKNNWNTFLLTQNPVNLAYYQRFGFKLLDQRTTDDMPLQYLMGRNTEKEVKTLMSSGLTKWLLVGSAMVIGGAWIKFFRK